MPAFTKVLVSRILSLLFFLLVTGGLFAQRTTSIHGKVIDDRNDEPLAYATAQLPEAKTGTHADISGNFLLETTQSATQLRVTYVGYTTQIVTVQAGVPNEVIIRLVDEAVNLREVEIRPDKYRRKNNPAVDLIGEVFAHKDRNRKEGLDFYNYEFYEKLQFDLNNISDKFRNRRSLRKFQFVFENVDTNQVNGKVALPVYLRERNYTLNQPLPDSLFRSRVTTITDESVMHRAPSFWLENRHNPLSKQEQGIYRLVDSIQNVPAFQRTMNIAVFVLAGYKSFGGIEVGPVNTFYGDPYPGKGTAYRSQRRHRQYLPAVPGGLCASADLYRPARREQMGHSGAI